MVILELHIPRVLDSVDPLWIVLEQSFRSGPYLGAAVRFIVSTSLGLWAKRVSQFVRFVKVVPCAVGHPYGVFVYTHGVQMLSAQERVTLLLICLQIFYLTPSYRFLFVSEEC